MKVCKIISFTAFIIFSSNTSSAAEATYGETAVWIQDAFSRYANDGYGGLVMNSCLVAFYDKDSDDEYYRHVINLKTMKINNITWNQYGTHVYFYSKSDKNETLRIKEPVYPRKYQVTEHIEIGISDRGGSMAERIASAFRHMAKLCGADQGVNRELF